MSAFVVTIECANCGNEFDREYEAGVLVEDTSTRAGSTKKEIVETTDGDIFVGAERVECPVCERDGCLSVTDRSPVGDAQDDSDEKPDGYSMVSDEQ